ncbi:mitochondrial carrier domain-containing protein [Annulohypoxylon maeteangense]|uniref:mitochondrial carrier domain-containing protein n=1 Tax=Annulohypoxylon maeteangense TaxID=1927788 RepID=UPI002007F771|nr:mitochondrial carrier domain-containing protein [Annulohypoxylon maeteangense]KAI0885129.1 mitochondrial carrier domain-containing protein [Annulohypoxylon maeteangense]
MVAGTDGKTSPVISLVAGGIAGGVESACTYPFEFAKTRVQLYGHEGIRNPFMVVAKVAREEGLRALYKGCSTMIVVCVISLSHSPIDLISVLSFTLLPCCLDIFLRFLPDDQLVIPSVSAGKMSCFSGNYQFPEKPLTWMWEISDPPLLSARLQGSIGKDAVRFVTFDSIRSLFEDPETHRSSTAQSIASGMLTGILASTLIVTPSERIKTALIDDSRTTQRFRSPLHCISTLIHTQGLRRALYSGYIPTTLKQTGTTGFRLGTYAALKDWESSHFGASLAVSSTSISFANGAVAGTITTLATQPFDTVKTTAQQAKVVSLGECVRGIYREDGVRGFWRGTVMRLGRTVMAGGILFAANEQALRGLKAVFG